MIRDSEIRQFIQTLRPTQQTLDFDDANPWQSLPESDRRACCEAITSLLKHIASVTGKHGRTSEPGGTQENEHE